MSDTGRFRLSEAVRDPGGTHDCPRWRRCGGMLFHIYNDAGDAIDGMACTACDYMRLLAEPLRLPEFSGQERTP